MKRFLTVFVVLGMIAVLGCSGPTTPNSDKDIEAFFAGVSPILTGEVGTYKFIGNDGSIETGILIANEAGEISMVSERGSSVFENFWFIIGIDYLNPRGWTGMGLPYYFLGDTFTYKVNVDYKRRIPLNWGPFLHAALRAEQRYYPGGGLLPPGESAVDVWDPLYLAPYENVTLTETFTIIGGTVPGNDATWVKIDAHIFFGWIQWRLAYGICGLWDP